MKHRSETENTSQTGLLTVITNRKSSSSKKKVNKRVTKGQDVK